MPLDATAGRLPSTLGSRAASRNGAVTEYLRRKSLFLTSFHANTQGLGWLAKGMLFSFPFLFKAEVAHLVKRESEAVMREYPSIKRR